MLKLRHVSKAFNMGSIGKSDFSTALSMEGPGEGPGNVSVPVKYCVGRPLLAKFGVLGRRNFQDAS